MKFNRIDDRIGCTMVLEDVFGWFKELDATTRLSVMHGLLNMCHPVELRFLGHCLEDLCKKDFLMLRDREQKANSGGELQKLSDLNDDGVRTQMIVAVALLQASNRSCATTVFNTLTSYLPLELNGIVGADADRGARLVTEILLLMNMVLMHPAFTFEQKRTIEHHLKLVNDQYPGRNSSVLSGAESEFTNHPMFYQQPVGVPSTLPPERGGVFNCNYIGGMGTLGSNTSVAVVSPMINSLETPYPATTCCSVSSGESAPPSRASSCSTKSSTVSTGSPKAQIKMLELKNAQRKKRAAKYRIQVTWSNGEVTEICKTHQELVSFHQQLINFQDEPGHKERYIPYFTGPKPIVGNKSDDAADEGMGKMADYLKQLMVKVPHHLLDSELVTKFFRGQSVSSLSTTNISQTSNCDVSDGLGQRGCQTSASNYSSSSSSSLSSSSSVSLPASPPPSVSNLTTVSNSLNCPPETIVDSVDLKMKSLTIYNSHQTTEGSPMNARTHQPLLDTMSRSTNEDKLLELVFLRERMANDLDELRKKFDKKEMLNLTEADLIKEGYDLKKAKQIISRLEAFRSQLPNGFPYYGLDYHPTVSISSCDVTTPPPPVVLQRVCHAVHPVQNQIYMPEAPLDCLVNYSMAPIGYMEVDRSAIHTPTDLSTPNSPAERYQCNGTIERVESPHTSHTQTPLKGFEIGGISRQQSLNGGRGGHQRPINKGRIGNRRESLTSLKSTSNGQEPNKNVGTGELNDSSSINPAVSPPNVTCGEGEGNFTSANVIFTQPDNCHAVGKMIPSFTATTSVTYSVSQQHQQQQVIGSHQQQIHPHLAGGITTMGVPRLPRPATLTTNLCSYTFMPLNSSVYPIFSPPPGSQTSYIATHSTNGYVSHQQPNYYTPLQSPDCLPTDMSIPSAITNRFPPIQQSGGTVVTQPAPPPGMIARTTVQHTSMPPQTSPVPGFLTGPTPNVGFHGNPISVLPVPTQLPLCGGMNPSIPSTYVIANPNVRLKHSCFNCGHGGHQGAECGETTMDESNRGSQFRLLYHPDDVNVDGCD